MYQFIATDYWLLKSLISSNHWSLKHVTRSNTSIQLSVAINPVSRYRLIATPLIATYTSVTIMAYSYRFGVATDWLWYSDNDEKMGGEEDNDSDLSWKMLDITRAIIDKSPENAIEKVKIYSALAEVATERGSHSYFVLNSLNF